TGPTAQEPTVQEPTVQLPSATEPTAQEPTAQEPTVQLPQTAEPTAEEPPVQLPAATQPTAQEPTVQLPAATQPTAQEPAAREPSSTLGHDQAQTTPLGYDHTQAEPLWFDKLQEQPRYPAYPPAASYSPTEPRPPVYTDQGSEQTAKPRRLTELVIVAALAAVLSSGSTYALTRGDVAASPPVQSRSSATNSSAPVVQANADTPNWAVTAAAVSPSVVAITVTSGQGGDQGSGVIFDTSGHILTNNHVVAGAGQGSQITVTLNDLRTYDATVVGTDPSTDLAVIKLTNGPKDLKAIALGDAGTVKVGEPVMAVGNPLGLAGTVTTGIVSALNRPVTTSDQQQNNPFGQQSASSSVVTNAIQTSAAINPGNSGGALVNASGQLIGINSSIASLGSSSGTSSQSGNIGIGFAIPVDQAQSIAEQLITSGTAKHAYLGVSSKDDVVADGSAKRAAAVVVNVVGGTPAAKAGLQAGDAIIAVDGKAVDGSLSLVAQVRERTVGDKVVITIVRNGQTKELSATLTSKPASNQ
ncbi:MAG: trypsin-like peptidase domain-containing protein, partial [Dermatophilaceae bacterium]